MKTIDVFNGDADGICALIQLRLVQPVKAELVTGVKRAINLLDDIADRSNQHISVLDISLDKNRIPLLKLLQQENDILYIDHHFAGDIPNDRRLKALINTSSDICTSLIMHQYLDGSFPAWAAVGAFGDNLIKNANSVIQNLGLSNNKINQLMQLGICINYNAYGSTLEDLHILPTALYLQLVNYLSPFDFIADNPIIFQQLQDALNQDLLLANQILPKYLTDKTAIYFLPDEKWARRVNGVFGNYLASQHPNRAHAIINCQAQANYQISVRAPMVNPKGADDLCRKFNGGGRKLAAGINHLNEDKLSEFIAAFTVQYQ